MCENIGDGMAKYCPNSSGESEVIPEMRMYFHSGITDYVLFKEWVATNHLVAPLQILTTCFPLVLTKLNNLSSGVFWNVRLFVHLGDVFRFSQRAATAPQQQPHIQGRVG